MFRTTSDIVEALRRAKEPYDPQTTSLLLVRRTSHDPLSDPFRAGFLQWIEERHELSRLVGSLDERSKQLLLQWFVEDRPVAHIARELGISRVHCYRLKEKALNAMLEASHSRANRGNGRRAERRLLALAD